jgi:hypothetical protein
MHHLERQALCWVLLEFAFDLGFAPNEDHLNAETGSRDRTLDHRGRGKITAHRIEGDWYFWGHAKACLEKFEFMRKASLNQACAQDPKSMPHSERDSGNAKRLEVVRSHNGAALA